MGFRLAAHCCGGQLRRSGNRRNGASRHGLQLCDDNHVPPPLFRLVQGVVGITQQLRPGLSNPRVINATPTLILSFPIWLSACGMFRPTTTRVKISAIFGSSCAEGWYHTTENPCGRCA